MSKKKILVSIIAILFVIFCNVYLVLYKFPIANEDATLKVRIKGNQQFVASAYYLHDGQDPKNGFMDSQVVSVLYDKDPQAKTLGFVLPGDASAIRLDIGDKKGIKADVLSADIIVNNKKILKNVINDDSIFNTNTIKVKCDSDIKVTTSGNDSYLVFNMDTDKIQNVIITNCKDTWMIKRIAMIVAFDLICLLFFLKRKTLFSVPIDSFRNRKLLMNLSKNDFKTRFAGSYLGIVWAFVQPIVTVILYWFVFEKALHAGSQSTKAGITVPYVLWLIAGLVPWFYFSEAWTLAANALVEYSYLVKKVVFNIRILPMVKVISSMFVHVFFVAFTLILYSCYGFFPNFHTLQIIYYSFSMVVLVTALAYFCSAAMVFFRDLLQIINIFMQVIMWMTPIMWNIDTLQMSPVIKKILELNPMYYVISGYRDSLINHVWFFDKPGMTIYFWTVTLLLFAFGTVVFERLQSHFADVL